MWVKPVLYLFTFLMNTLRRLKIYLLKGEKSLSAEMELFYRAVALRRNKINNEKHEEILGKVIVCLRKIERYLNCDSSPGTPWRTLSGTIRSRELDRVETVHNFRNAFVHTHRRRRNGSIKKLF